MQKLYKNLSVLVLIAIICLSFNSCYPVYIDGMEKTEINEESFQVVGEPTMRFEYDEEYREYDIYVEGIVKNLSDSNAYVCISYVIYDADGNTIATVYGYCEHLEAEGTWRFCATGYSPYEPASFKLISLY